MDRLLPISCLLLAVCASTDERPDPPPTARPVAATPSASKTEYLEIAKKNVCPEGFPLLQGEWRFIGQTRTPEFKDELSVKGTRFVEQMSGKPDGKSSQATLRGEIRCLFKNRVLMSIETVEPEGGFDNHSGDVFPCDVLTGLSDSDHLLLICFFEWDLRVEAGLEFEYARIVK